MQTKVKKKQPAPAPLTQPMVQRQLAGAVDAGAFQHRDPLWHVTESFQQTFDAIGRRHARQLGGRSVTRRQPEICVSYNRQYFLNPGHPKTKEYLMSLVREVVTRYDVDGIHLDYLRYPNRARNFPDRAQFRTAVPGIQHNDDGSILRPAAS